METTTETGWSAWQNTHVRIIRVGRSLASRSSCRTINEGIARSSSGDRIEVEGGEYFESISIPHCVELAAADTTDPPHIISRGPCINLTTDEPVYMHGLCVAGKGVRPSDAIAVLIVRGRPTIEHCTLSCVHVGNGATPTIRHCRITESESGSGLKLLDRAGGLYESNEISHHNTHCIEISTSASPTFIRNTIFQKHLTHALVTITGGKHGKLCAPIFEENSLSGTGETAEEAVLRGNINSLPTKTMLGELEALPALMSVAWGASPVLRANYFVRGSIGLYAADTTIVEPIRENRFILSSGWGIAMENGVVCTLADNDITRCIGGVRLSFVREVTVESCSIAASTMWGLYAQSSTPTINKCTISGNDPGIALVSGTEGVYTANRILGNKTDGVLISRSIGTFTNNFFLENRGCGVRVTDQSYTTFRENQFGENKVHNVFVTSGSFIRFHNNNCQCPALHSLAVTEGSGGEYTENTFSEASSAAHIAVAHRSSGLFARNTIKQGHVAGISVEGFAVPTISNNTFTSLKEAVRVASSGDPLVVGNIIGTCTFGFIVEDEGLGTFTGNSLRLCSEAFVCIRSKGDPVVRDNRLSESDGHGIVVESCGLGVIEKNRVEACTMGSLLLDGPGSNPVVRRNSFGSTQGYGVVVSNGAEGRVVENEIMKAVQSGVRILSEAKTYIGNNTVYDNMQFGIVCESLSSATVSRNVIRRNKHAGVRLDAQSNSRFDHNRVCENEKEGVQILSGSCSTMNEDIVAENSSFGVSVGGGPSRSCLQSVHIEGNEDHGVFISSGGSCELRGCHIANNKGCGLVADQAGPALVDDCIIEDHETCVLVTRGGQTTFRNTKILKAAKVLLFVDRKGSVTVQKTSFRESQLDAICLGEHVDVVLSEVSVENCPGAGLVLRDAHSHVDVNMSQFRDCATGIVFSAPSSPQPVSPSTVALSGSQRAPDDVVIRTTVVAQMTGIGVDCGAHRRGVVTECSVSNCEVGFVLSDLSCVNCVGDTTLTGCRKHGIVVNGPRSTPTIITAHCNANRGCGICCTNAKPDHASQLSRPRQ